MNGTDFDCHERALGRRCVSCEGHSIPSEPRLTTTHSKAVRTGPIYEDAT